MTSGQPSSFTLRDESGRVLCWRRTLREAEREGRRLARPSGTVTVHEAGTLVMTVVCTGPHAATVTRHGRYAESR